MTELSMMIHQLYMLWFVQHNAQTHLGIEVLLIHLNRYMCNRIGKLIRVFHRMLYLANPLHIDHFDTIQTGVYMLWQDRLFRVCT